VAHGLTTVKPIARMRQGQIKRYVKNSVSISMALPARSLPSDLKAVALPMLPTCPEQNRVADSKGLGRPTVCHCFKRVEPALFKKPAH